MPCIFLPVAPSFVGDESFVYELSSDSESERTKAFDLKRIDAVRVTLLLFVDREDEGLALV